MVQLSFFEKIKTHCKSTILQFKTQCKWTVLQFKTHCKSTTFFLKHSEKITSLGLCFPICKMEMVIVPVSGGCWKH